MEKVYVQFADELEESIIAVFSCPQDETTYPNQGEIEVGDERYVEFLSPVVIGEVTQDPLEKLRSFLLANPDVADVLK